MKAVCIDSSNSEVLQEGMTYYVFPHGQQAFYVSKFDNINSHTGAFQKDRFKVIEQEKTEETSDNYTQMNLFEFLGEDEDEEDEVKGIEIVIPKDVLCPLENSAGLRAKKFREGQLRWRSYIKAVEEYHGCSFFEVRDKVFEQR